VVLRQQQRDALFNYEDTVRLLLFDVRRVFYTIIVRKQQITQRKVLLKEFREYYDQIAELEQARRVREVDVLTARLNVLNEKLRINALEKELHRQRIALMRLLGLPIERTGMKLQGIFNHFEIDVDRTVVVALQRSTQVAQARAMVWEQQRQARQIGWQNAPDISMRGGYKGDRTEGGINLARDDRGTFNVDGFAEGKLDQPDEDLVDDDAFPDRDDKGWFVDLFLSVPLFDGHETKGRRIREFARLEKTRFELRDTVDRVEVRVRQAYQTMLERMTELEIQEETVRISKQRLRVQEKLKELGKVRDDELETFRDRFFDDQDQYFRLQIALVEAQERLRFEMRYFDTNSPSEDKP